MLKEQNEAYKLSAKSTQDAVEKMANEKKAAAIKKVDSKLSNISTDLAELKLKLIEVEDWSTQTDLTITREMKEIDNQKKDLQKIVDMVRDVDNVVAENNLDEVRDELKLTECYTELQDVENELDEKIKNVEEQDKIRELYSLDEVHTDKLKLPTYSGKINEDYMKFKEDVIKAFVHNRVTRADKITKLRECLFGQAKNFVPESITTDIEEAWKVLDKAYGDPVKLMRFRKQKVFKLGYMPKESDKGGWKKQVEWLIEMESLLQSLLSLGLKNSECGEEIFPKKEWAMLLAMFPKSMATKLMYCPGSGSEKISNIIKKISEFRTTAQDWQFVEEVVNDGGMKLYYDSNTGPGGGGNRFQGGGNFGKQGTSANTVDLPALVFYKPPRRDENCRICNALNAKGDTNMLYENHHSNFPTGCPRYIGMTVEERNSIAKSSKICLKCHDPSYVYKRPDKNHKCDSNKKPNRYKCKESKCSFHMWCCSAHKEVNRESLVKFQLEIRQKHGLEFCFVSLPVVTTSQSLSPMPSFESPALPKSPRKKRKKKQRKSKSRIDNESPDTSEESDVAETEQVQPILGAKIDNKNLSSEEALKKVKNKLLKEGINEELHPVPKGRSQFMLGMAQGKTRPLLHLYDTGCGSILFKDGVPQKELSGCTLKTKGPYTVKGVGGINVTVNDEYSVTMGLVDGTRQVFEGWTMKTITDTLPFVNVESAVDEIKADGSNNPILQKLECQPTIGGDVDVLMGMLYKKVHPEPIHSLSNGLTIYKMKITPHNLKFNAVIGGPHETFKLMSADAGGIAIMFAYLSQQLETYKNFGPPKIEKNIMSFEDTLFAKQFQEWDKENFHCIQESKIDLQDIDEVTVPALEFTEEETDDTVIIDNEILCSSCGVELSGDYAKALDAMITDAVALRVEDEDDKKMKEFQKAQTEGLSISYRCPRCRSCVDCRRSFETERVSLREEAEDLMIWESVQIDWENKQIISYLPLRGKESEFLSSNRDIALRILDQQCSKFSKDIDTKNSVVKAFDKFIKEGQLVFLKDLTKEEQDIINSKPLSHYLVWRVVFKDSLSTPARPVFDGSQKTKIVEDGSGGTEGGRCLNDAVVKGRVTTLNLVKMVLRFTIGLFAMQGDLKSFYASIKLVRDQWHLQRVLFREDLNPEGDVLEAIFKTLIWGIKSISGQSECAVIKLAKAIKDEFPDIADLLINSRFVDDIGDSEDKIDKINKKIDDANYNFSRVGLKCKGWSVTESKPPPEVCEAGDVVSIGGMKWHTLHDLLEVPIPQLHFGKKIRGKLQVGTQIFEGRFVEDMEKFVPRNLTRRMIFSKKYCFFDILGKFMPIDAKLKLDLREVTQLTEGWDDPIPPDIRSKWVQNFLRMEKLRGIKFKRAKMPINAASAKMNVIFAGDAANEVKTTGAWGRFKLKNGKFSCQHLIGRSLLADSTIPQNELEGLTMTSNLSWIVRQALEKWMEEDYIVVNDSTISLCWTISDKKRLSLFHRNRTVQIRRAIDLEKLYHVVSEGNPADIGTRPNQVKDEDVGPDSIWENGLHWMREDISKAVENGILTPVSNLKVSKEDEDEFNKGIIIEKTPEILTRGHAVLLSTRVENVKQRSELSNYLIDPNKFTFEKAVMILSVVWKFLKSFSVMKRKKKAAVSDHRFEMFITLDGKGAEIDSKTDDDSRDVKLHALTSIFRCNNSEIDVEKKSIYKVFDDKYVANFKTEGNENIIDVLRLNSANLGHPLPGWVCGAIDGQKFKNRFHVLITDENVNDSLTYLFQKGTAEVKKFVKPDTIRKIAVEKNGILFSKSRILDGYRFQIAGGLEPKENLFQFGIKMFTPVLERYSPLSYSIADYIHRIRANHRGYETCFRESLCHVFILQGLGLFREISEDCVKCAKVRGRFIEASMGPLSDAQLTVAPAFWITMSDLMGPIDIFRPGQERQTRNTKAEPVKAYVLVSVCPTTKCVNLQVLEGKGADSMVEGLNRLGCEVGFPSYFLIDQDSALLKCMREAEVNLKDLQNMIYKERKIKFKTCPVGAHNYHGAVERRIRTIEELMEKAGIFKLKVSATGLQTVMKLIENEVNNVPLGYMYGRDSDNSPLLKLIFPNMLRTGRINVRSLNGPIRLPKGPQEMMKKIEDAYDVFFQVFNTSVVPKLLKMNKWPIDKKETLKIGDVVYFKKEEGKKIASPWSLGLIDSVERGKDGVVRRVNVKYSNPNENVHRFTDRCVRSLVKLFNLEDSTWRDDMEEVEKLRCSLIDDDEVERKNKTVQYVMSQVGDDSSWRYRLSAVGGYSDVVALNRQEGVQFNSKAKAAKPKFTKPCNACCCSSHCAMDDHKQAGKEVGQFTEQQSAYPDVFDSSWASLEDVEEDLATCYMHDGHLTDLVAAVNVDLSDAKLDDVTLGLHNA